MIEAAAHLDGTMPMVPSVSVVKTEDEASAVGAGSGKLTK